eukprot:11126819-Karenia_brevis.AAC.1
MRAAFLAAYPDFGRMGQHGLPYLDRALKGWKKQAPNGRVVNLPEAVLDAISMELLELGHRSTFLYLQLGFSCYLRPSENNRLSLGCLVAPASSGEGLN